MAPRDVRWVVALSAALALGATSAYAREMVVEGESLVAGARAQGGGASAQSMSVFGPGWSGGAQLMWTAAGPRSVLVVSIEAPLEADYDLAAFFTRAPDYGIVAVSARDQRLAVFDGLAERVVRSERVTLGRVHLAKGPNPLTFRVEGRNTRSRGHYMGLDALIVEAAGAVRLPPGIVRPPDTPVRKLPPTVVPHLEPSTRTRSLVMEPLLGVPRPRGTERREVLRTLATLENELLAQPAGATLRSAFPFGELRSLASVPLPELGAASEQRLGQLLAALDGVSLDTRYRAVMSDPSFGAMHEKVRDLVELSRKGLKVPGPAHDLAATEIFGSFQNLEMVKWLLRVHVVSCADDDGGYGATVTVGDVANCVALANQVFAPAHLRFAFDAATDWETVKNTALNRWDDAACAKYVADASHRGKIVVFYGWGKDPAAKAGGAANAGTHIVAGPDAGPYAWTFCHEVGHFLGRLYHTFPGDGNALIYGDLSKVTAANVDSVIADFIVNRAATNKGTVEAMDGDGFSDTPPDIGNDYWEKKFGAGTSCNAAFPTATIPGPVGQSWAFTPDRSNLLSYFVCAAVPTLTPQQIAGILGRLEGTVPQGDNQDLKRLIEGQVAWQHSSLDFVLVGKIRNVGTVPSSAGRTAVIEGVTTDPKTVPKGVPLGPPVPVPPLAAGDWMYVSVPMPGGTAWNGKACLTISPGDQDPSNDTFCPEPYKAPVVK
jgi:hypothetical protein